MKRATNKLCYLILWIHQNFFQFEEKKERKKGMGLTPFGAYSLQQLQLIERPEGDIY